MTEQRHRTHLQTDSLESYFEDNSISFDKLLSISNALYDRYMTTGACETARAGGDHAGTTFVSGAAWTMTAAGNQTKKGHEKQFSGDDTLANSILRMRDSMMHYEFQSAIADGDIGRAMNIMSVRLAIFGKYAVMMLTIVTAKGLDIHIYGQREDKILK
jgi:hypothetical protein